MKEPTLEERAIAKTKEIIPELEKADPGNEEADVNEMIEALLQGDSDNSASSELDHLDVISITQGRLRMISFSSLLVLDREREEADTQLERDFYAFIETTIDFTNEVERRDAEMADNQKRRRSTGTWTALNRQLQHVLVELGKQPEEEERPDMEEEIKAFYAMCMKKKIKFDSN